MGRGEEGGGWGWGEMVRDRKRLVDVRKRRGVGKK